MPAWWNRSSPKKGKSSSSNNSQRTIDNRERSKRNGDQGSSRGVLDDGVHGDYSELQRKGRDVSVVGGAELLLPEGSKLGHPLPRPSVSSLSTTSSDSCSSSSEDATEWGFSNFRYGETPTLNIQIGKSSRPSTSNCHPYSANVPDCIRPQEGHPHSTNGSQFMSSCGALSVSPRGEFHIHNPDLSHTGAHGTSSEIKFAGSGGRQTRQSTAYPLHLSPRARSPGRPISRCRGPTSPIHSRASGSSLESSNGKQEEGRGLCHPLPLPPGSPNSSSPRGVPSSPVTSSPRAIGAIENLHCIGSRWKKGRLLGRGTFGHVYVGFNSESGQMCAIKEVTVISDDRNSKESLRQLGQEISVLSQLSHPNIVRYYGSEMAEDALCIFLEYVSGGSIYKLLQEYGPFKEPVIRSYTGQILSGLAYLHKRNTLHRDIKGANILVDPNGDVKLADFGMAKHVSATSSLLSFKGSPYWMAPEVTMHGNGYNLAVDIWSLGCTIIEMATSKPPWSQYEGMAVIFKIANSKDIPEIPYHLSEDGKHFLRLCLQRDPSARPTATRLLDHPFVRDQTSAKAAKPSLLRNQLSLTNVTQYQDLRPLHIEKEHVLACFSLHEPFKTIWIHPPKRFALPSSSN
ncbi:hypothetical protein AMTR_s00071p00019220 [Amborella trichopoda]|uniref:mitogen-activated protein kinase kinase kinase n=1 Tax=Amborella trichopoda TaxID=13333 RepID=U5D2K3_AMBTC|nr:hypothetical protein AMTR_s00071p00019220 [Amborella trichopoda]